MPPNLDLTKSHTHANMILATRQSPRLSLRRIPSYNANDKGPSSSTSGRFNFNSLLSEPLPSPSLPALIPRHGKPLPPRRSRTCVRVLTWLAGVCFIAYYGTLHLRLNNAAAPAVGWSTHSGEEFEMVGEDAPPDFATPVVVSDARGRAKWTVSVPVEAAFPLSPLEYRDICRQSAEVSAHVVDLHRHAHKDRVGHYDYYHVDPNFMDVAEAEEHGLLPGIVSGMWDARVVKAKNGNLVGVDMAASLVESGVCEMTMTFVMESPDAGLGKTLMALWTAYGLAQKEGRAFFVDDTRWAYGKYTSFFKPPPQVSCHPPPRHQMIPCPHHAAHLVVSAGTTAATFGGKFNDFYEDAHKMGVLRSKEIFGLARAGYEALFQLGDEDAGDVARRVAELREKTVILPSAEPDVADAAATTTGTIAAAVVDPPAEHRGIVIGIHVRHGDRHPLEFQYRDSYIPLDRYAATARELLQARFAGGPDDDGGSEDYMAEMRSMFVVASDDPDVYESQEFSHAMRAQEKIRLASQHTLRASVAAGGTAAAAATARRANAGALIRGFVEETVGWEGGWYAGIFWSLGRAGGGNGGGGDNGAKKNGGVGAAAAAAGGPGPSREALRLRELVGRAYLMDLGVLGAASDRVVCTVSSNGCRLLAVMMGWERAVLAGEWVNIDGDFEWRGVEW